MPPGTKLVLAMAIAVTAFGEGHARADCNSGADYFATVKANTVEIALEETARTCGGSIPMLRQNTQTGEVVKLGNYCVKAQYVDECVPPGIYRYGFETAYGCSEQGCGGEQYYVEVTVPTVVPTACTVSPGNAEPTVYDAPVPWASSPSQYVACPSGCGCSIPGHGVLGFDGALVAIAGMFLWRRRRARR